MMKKYYKIVSLVLMAAMMCTMISGTALAATKKKINSVTITISGHIEAEDKFGEEDIDISASGSHYDFSEYESTNVGFRWSSDDVPELKIYLTAEDGYYFNITKASQVTINGGTYKSAAREDGSTTLVVTVVLPSLANQAYEVPLATFSADGTCKWEAADNSGSYEVKFMRSNTTLGGIQTTTGTSINCGQYMTKAGDYYFKVRSINKNDPTVASIWTESDHVSISGAQANEFKQANIEAQSAGSWVQDATGWWFKLPDGTYPAAAWRQIYGEWYYFGADGYMMTGWQTIGGKWYYLDPTSGAMWKNTTTPDGYEVSIDGSMVTK